MTRATRVSTLFGKTLREEPAEAEIPSHRLMLKAGMIYQAASGVYAYLPLAWRSLRKIELIIREEMDAAGGQEVRLSILQPRELWDLTGRTQDWGPDMFNLKDRRDRPLVLAPTHEELLTSMVRVNVRSYRDLPMIIYQVHTKFRDEPRPRAGLLRVREFDMKDAYSFDVDEAGLDRSYQAMAQAYKNIYARCGVAAIPVEADSGAIGGKDNHEFVLPAESGEDTVVLCDACGYAANVEKARFRKPALPAEAPLPLEEVHTPGVKTIADLAGYLGVPTGKTWKAVFYAADGQVVAATIRGDLEVNEVKLRNALRGAKLRLATAEEVRAAGLVPGSASAIGLHGVRTVADDSIGLGSNFVAGANREGYHLRNANYPRDLEPDVVADIALVGDGYRCPTCDGVLAGKKGIEVGHIFKLGTKYSEALGATVQLADGTVRPILMGCYGIGLGRLLAAAIEQHHDEKGIVFPVGIAPFHVSLVALNADQPEVAEAAEALARDLDEAGIEVLYDDRADSAGVKLNDADLVGLPVRAVVSARNLRQDAVEVKARAEAKGAMVPRQDAVERISRLLKAPRSLGR